MFKYFKIRRYFKVGDKIRVIKREPWHREWYTITIKQVGNYCYLVSSANMNSDFEVPFSEQSRYEIVND